jgi:uncharacterized protein (TIRG00374 family)
VKLAVSVGLLWLLLSRVDGSRFWRTARTASPVWLGVALAFYGAMVTVSAWRWGLLLRAQRVPVSTWFLLQSFLVATFFNNFLPSNIGGDVVRITDTARVARSKTLATTVVLIDRALGLLALVLVAAIGASVSNHFNGGVVGPIHAPLLWSVFTGGLLASAIAVARPSSFIAMFSPLRIFHRRWVDERLKHIEQMLRRVHEDPAALIGSALGAVAVQVILVAFYAAIAYSIAVPISAWQLAGIVPVSFLAQMLPISLNGFGVREATFVFYFTRLGLPIETALMVSFLGAALVMLFSLCGAVVHMTRQ